MNLRICFSSFRLLVSVLTVLASLTPRPALAQQPTTKDWAFGYQAFNLLLQESDLKICQVNEWRKIPADEKLVVLISQPPRWLPIRRETPALVMCSSGESLNARFRPSLGEVDRRQTKNFYSTPSCPIVRPSSTQEVFVGVRELVCNTPGYISSRSALQQIDEQFYPPTSNQYRRGNSRSPQRFSVLATDPARRVWVADPQLFTNQMIFKGDNLRFADNVVRWLSGDYNRKNVLLVINGKPQLPVDPADLDILTPIPTHEEVIEAISKLPTMDMAKFANSVVRLSEDENIFNDMAKQYIDGLEDGQINRLILFVVFASCCVFGLITYFWQRRVLRRTASVTASRRQKSLSKRASGSEASERQAAASMLLNSFCLDVANRRLADWPEFPTPIVGQQRGGPAVTATNEMADFFWRLRTKPNTYWTKENLTKLEQATNHWRILLEEDRITFETQPT